MQKSCCILKFRYRYSIKNIACPRAYFKAVKTINFLKFVL